MPPQRGTDGTDADRSRILNRPNPDLVRAPVELRSDVAKIPNSTSARRRDSRRPGENGRSGALPGRVPNAVSRAGGGRGTESQRRREDSGIRVLCKVAALISPYRAHLVWNVSFESKEYRDKSLHTASGNASLDVEFDLWHQPPAASRIAARFQVFNLARARVTIGRNGGDYRFTPGFAAGNSIPTSPRTLAMLPLIGGSADSRRDAPALDSVWRNVITIT